MAIPDKTVFNIGVNAYGQPVKLIHERDTAGRLLWNIHRDPANQRDDHSHIGGLTKEMIQKMAECVD